MKTFRVWIIEDTSVEMERAIKAIVKAAKKEGFHFDPPIETPPIETEKSFMDIKNVMERTLRASVKVAKKEKEGSHLELRCSSSLDKLPQDGGAHRKQLPHLVILDLYEGGSVLRGNEFYDELRKAEQKGGMKRAEHSALVIVWSAYTGDPDAEKFIRETSQSDSRMIKSIETKDHINLEREVWRCLRRIEEEMSALPFDDPPT